MTVLISIIIPFHNEEKNVNKLINKTIRFLSVCKIKGEVIAIDDRSTDTTGQILDRLVQKNKCIKLIHRKGGESIELGYAIKDGINIANGSTIIVMMGDSSDNPEDIIKMLKKIREGYDVVCGSRFIKDGYVKNYPLVKHIFNRIWNILFSFLFGLHIKDISNAFKAYRKDFIESIDIESRGFEITAEIVLKAHINGLKITEVPVSWHERELGESKFGSFSFRFIFTELPLIGWCYGKLALKLWFKFLHQKINNLINKIGT